jgi:hypothetical protein
VDRPGHRAGDDDFTLGSGHDCRILNAESTGHGKERANEIARPRGIRYLRLAARKSLFVHVAQVHFRAVLEEGAHDGAADPGRAGSHQCAQALGGQVHRDA